MAYKGRLTFPDNSLWGAGREKEIVWKYVGGTILVYIMKGMRVNGLLMKKIAYFFWKNDLLVPDLLAKKNML